ncbi:ankyrin repeat domain-containing protein 34B-like [Paramormyrops kingsleyae]|uniref:Ankyrin repeat domain 34Bb n=1 Tax=Paramormyrops kingsleyae TaxID=1676925 RepID=A0A3B3SP62_9TELE|nr:ankyrin repeat domain-containing protein 34B-like [Paramormyrops kingsleyae]XP_023694681.1 ankyrin repeat domain-containing protein 34B-like [Paramormyrops kingsleyae]
MEFHADGNSLLKAVYLSRLRLTRLLLEGGAYINESNERGETPLMVACKTRHVDPQSADKIRMVRYLLESGADPNIQDKRGRTALMHACLEHAGAEVITLLLNNGADTGLEDHSGTSALVYAVHADDKDALRVLLDACKAQGKEVIIITTDKLPSGRQMAKQYLNVPPPLDLGERRPCGPTLSTSLSDIEIQTSPWPVTCHQAEKNIFAFGVQKEDSAASSQPNSPSRGPGLVHSGVAKLQHLQRLHSEPWLKIPPSLLEENRKASPLTKDLPDITPDEEPYMKFSRRFQRVPGANPHSPHAKKLGKTLERLANNDERDGGSQGMWLSRKMSYDNISFARSHPDLYHSSRVAGTPTDKDPAVTPGLAISSLHSIVQRRNIGVDHYGSDSQLSQYLRHLPEDYKGHPDKGLPVSNSYSALSSSRDSLEKQLAMREHRGSGALPAAYVTHPRAGFLPPLNQHVPVPQIEVTGVNVDNVGMVPKTNMGLKVLVPSAPSVPRDLKARKMLLRRHSMQTDPIKQLGTFEEIFSH